MNPIFFSLAIALSAAVSGLAIPAHAAAGHSYEFGAPGKPASATRSITVNLADNYYEPDAISVKQGETVRFVLKNNGELQHEFSIGTLAAHTEHRKEMAQMMEMREMDHSKMVMPSKAGKPMRHDDPNMVLLAPGESKELLWKFTRAMEIEFACNMPGHYESGMLGRIDFFK